MRKVRTVDRTWILAEYKLDGDILDTSGNANNGTATNVTYVTSDRWYTAQCAVFWATSHVTAAAMNNAQSCQFLIYPTTNTVTVLKSSIDIISINSSNVLTTVLSSPTFYVNNVQTTTVTLNAWNNVVVNFNTASATSPNFWADSFQWNAAMFRMFTVRQSLDNIQSMYMEGMRKLWWAWLVPLTDGLIAYYDMNGDANDIVGGKDMTVNWATLTTDRFSTANNTYNFNGTSNYIQSTTNDIFLWLTWVSIACWVNTSNATGIKSIFSDGGFINIFQNLSANDGKINCYTDGNNWVFADSTASIADGNWHFVCLTATSTTVKCYVDGVLNNTASNILNTWTHSRKWAIWGAYDGSTFFFNGNIDDVFLFSRTLSDSEVLALYQLSSQRYITSLIS